MIDLQYLATIDPRVLLTNWEFWLRSRGLVLQGAIALIAVVALWPFAVPQSISSGGWLSLAILALAPWGLVLGCTGLATAEVDCAIAQIVERRANDRLAEIAGGAPRPIVDRLAGELLPENPNRETGILRFFRGLLDEAIERRFPVLEAALQPFREEAASVILHVQGVQRIAFQLGVLGTFVGFIQALAKLDRSQAGAADLMAEMSGALHLSFGSSIAGLEVALILALLLPILRRRQDELFQSAETAAAAVARLARRSDYHDDLLVEFDQVRSSVNLLSDRVREQNREIETQTGEIRSGISRLGDVRGEFDGFLDGVRSELRKLLDETRSVSEILAPRQVAAELRDSLLEAQRELTSRFREDLDLGMERLERSNVSLRLTSEVERTGKSFREAGSELLDLLRDAATAHEQWRSGLEVQRELNAGLSAGAAEAASAAGRLERGFGDLGRRLEGLTLELERHNRLLTDSRERKNVDGWTTRFQSWWIERFRRIFPRRAEVPR